MAIELCEKKPPANEEGILFEKSAADNATVKGIIPFDELEKNGIRAYSRWPDKKSIGPRVARHHNNYEAIDWNTAKDRHFVVNLQVDYEAAWLPIRPLKQRFLWRIGST
jgi:hypothetical protein